MTERKTWTPVRSPVEGKPFRNTPEARAFFAATRSVAPGWLGQWSLVRDVLSQPHAVRCGPARLLAIDLLADFRQSKTGLLVAPGTFRNGRRGKAGWLGADMLALDIDDGSDPETIITAFAGCGLILHSSWNDCRVKDGKPAVPRWRAYLFLSQRIKNPSRWTVLWRWVADYLRQHGVTVDEAAKDTTRIMYTLRDGASHPPRVEGHPAHWIAAVPGTVLDLENLPTGASLFRLVEAATRKRQRAANAARAALRTTGTVTGKDFERAAKRRLRGAIHRLITTRPPGKGRNTGIYAAAAVLGSYVASGLITGPDISAARAAISAAAESAGVLHDVERQIENGFAHGLERPLEIGGGR